MNPIGISIFVGLILLTLIGTFGTVVNASPELSGSGGGTWKYQRDISIKENSGTTLTDYQVLIELKGADFPSEAQSSGADVRFTDSNNNELSYWIESWDYAGKSAKVWVKVPSIAAASIAVIHMYYGNPSARSSSNGDATFELFDDFNNNIKTTWTERNMGGTWMVQNQRMEWSSQDGETLNSITKEGSISAIPFVMEYNGQSTGSGGRGNIRQPGWIIWTSSSKYFGFGPYTNGNKVFQYGYSYTSVLNSGYANANNRIKLVYDGSSLRYYVNDALTAEFTLTLDATIYLGLLGYQGGATSENAFWVDNFHVREYASSEPTITLASPKSSSLSIIKSVSPYSIRQFQETAITITIDNSGTTDVKAIEAMDTINPSFDLVSGDFPNPKKFDVIHAGESREIQYTIRAKESGAFTLDPATVTYADRDGNIQEVKSEPVSIKVVPSSDGSVSGAPSGQPSKSSASVSLHGEKTDVVLGEDILFRLSAVNLITKPKMHVQVIIIPPSGMSVTSSEFSKVAAGQFTTSYELDPGDGKDIEVRIRSNQVGDFNVNGRIVYYFGDEKDNGEDTTLNLPIKVRKEITSSSTQNLTANPAQKSIPGFGVIIGLSELSFIILLKRRLKLY